MRAGETLLMFNGKDLLCVWGCSEAKGDTEKGSLRALLAGITEAGAEGSWVQLICSSPTTEQVVGVCTQIRRVGITSFQKSALPTLMQFAESLSSSVAQVQCSFHSGLCPSLYFHPCHPPVSPPLYPRGTLLSLGCLWLWSLVSSFPVLPLTLPAPTGPMLLGTAVIGRAGWVS